LGSGSGFHGNEYSQFIKARLHEVLGLLWIESDIRSRITGELALVIANLILTPLVPIAFAYLSSLPGSYVFGQPWFAR
jgi:hypothetical protein